eukprot:INCI2049.1.p1 GENE.INCI2049.1~~INCI2049.1.p1  ORF type:complete len:443 (-),score=88.35 INCI2049.1:424-1752(-)
MVYVKVKLKPKHTFIPRGIKGPEKEKSVVHEFFVDDFDQVINLKLNIFKAWGIPVEDQKLIYCVLGKNPRVMFSSDPIANFEFGDAAYEVTLRFTTAREKDFVAAEAKKMTSTSVSAMAQLEQQAALACFEEDDDDEFGETWRQQRYLQTLKIFEDGDSVREKLRKIAAVVDQFVASPPTHSAREGQQDSLHNGELKLRFIAKLKKTMGAKLLKHRAQQAFEAQLATSHNKLAAAARRSNLSRLGPELQQMLGQEASFRTAKKKLPSPHSAGNGRVKFRGPLRKAVECAAAGSGWKDILKKHDVAVKRTRVGGRYDLPSLFAIDTPLFGANHLASSKKPPPATIRPSQRKVCTIADSSTAGPSSAVRHRQLSRGRSTLKSLFPKSNEIEALTVAEAIHRESLARSSKRTRKHSKNSNGTAKLSPPHLRKWKMPLTRRHTTAV